MTNGKESWKCGHHLPCCRWYKVLVACESSAQTKSFAEHKKHFQIHMGMRFSPNEAIMWLHTPSAGLHIVPIPLKTWEEAEHDCWEQVSGLQLPSPAHCLPLNSTPSVGLAAICPVPVTKMPKIANTVQLLSTGSTGLPWGQSMNSVCSLHYTGNTVFTLLTWAIVKDKQGLKTYRQREDVCQQPSSRKHSKNSQKKSFLQDPPSKPPTETFHNLKTARIQTKKSRNLVNAT